METNVQPVGEPVVQTAKNPTAPMNQAVDLMSVDLERGRKFLRTDQDRTDYTISKSPRRSKHQNLVPNSAGRMVFGSLFGALLNFFVLAGISVVCFVLEGLLFTALDAPVTLHLANFMGGFILLISALILLLPTDMSFAIHLHPFVPKAKSKLGSLSSGRRKRTSNSEERKKVIKVTSYEDWPDPIPFPAKALYSFNTTSTSELSFNKGDPLVVVECRGNWWQAKHRDSGRSGFIPSNFVQVIPKAHIVKKYLASSEDEVSVQEGQTVELMEHHEFASLIRTVEGSIGSVPTSCLEPVPDSSSEKLKI